MTFGIFFGPPGGGEEGKGPGLFCATTLDRPAEEFSRIATYGDYSL